MLPDSLLATGIVLVNLRWVLEPEASKIVEEQKDTGATLEDRIKADLLSYWQCPKTSGVLFSASCQCPSEITTVIQQLEANNWDFQVYNRFHVNDTKHHHEL